MKKCFLAFKIIVTTFLLTNVFYKAHAANIVGLCTIEPASSSTRIKLDAAVEAKLDSSPTNPYHSYRLGITLPKAVVPDIHVNQSVAITLPVIRNRKVNAVITAISGRKIHLLLSGQVQQLEGQVLTTEISLKKEGLFLLPPQSIYSPRGIDPKIFVIKDNKASGVPVEVIQIMENGHVLVSSSQLINEKVICRGLNNPVSGDTVQVIETMGENL